MVTIARNRHNCWCCRGLETFNTDKGEYSVLGQGILTFMTREFIRYIVAYVDGTTV